MKNTVILLLFLITSCKSIGQIEQKGHNEIDNLIGNLSWESFEVVTNYAVELRLNQDSQKLVDFGKPASKKLFEALDKENKTVAAHLILTKIWEPSIFGIKICDSKIDDDLFDIEYTVNNLSWNRLSKEDKYHMSQQEKDKISTYWKKRIQDFDKID